MRPAKTVGPVDGGVAEEAATIPGIGEAIVPIASEIDFQILSWTPILLNIQRSCLLKETFQDIFFIFVFEYTRKMGSLYDNHTSTVSCVTATLLVF